ncbi:MAG: VanW family protein [Sarcina sp.]
MGQDNDFFENEDDQNTNGKSNEIQRGKNKKRLYFMIGIVIIIGIISSYMVILNNNVKKWENKVYPEVSLNGIAIGGKTKEEIKVDINTTLLDKMNDKKLKIVAKDKHEIIDYSNLKLKYNIEKAIDEALNCGKKDSIFKKNSYIKKGLDKNINIELSYDKDHINETLKNLNFQIQVNPKNATLNIKGEEIVAIEGEKGFSLDIEKSMEIIDGNISGDINNSESVLELPIKEIEPKIKSDMIKDINGKFSSASTSFNTGDLSRNTNLKIATQQVNGTILLPGEEFSYNEVVGERSTARGFKAAGAFSGGEVVQSIGGGICQISSTLYQAIMKSGIESTERYNHTMSVSYAKPSEDATVAWGYLDYKFKNPYKHPIYIQGIITDGIVTFNVYGNKEELDGRTFELVGVVTGTINPGSKRIADSKMAKGTQVVEKRPAVGRTSKGYLITYKNGEEVSRKEVSNDVYNSTTGIIRYGTKE